MIKTPITLLTGFLGSGKSTLLSQILQDPAFSNTAVIVNEFGEVGLDDFLVTHADEQVVEMTTGCLCCTVRGDVSNTLLDLWAKRDAGELPAFERVIIETTGLADPAPVIHTIATDPGIFTRFTLNGIVTTVDAATGLATLDLQEECIKQVAVADRIVLTKTDLDIDESALYDLQKRLDRLNPTAEYLERQSPSFNLEKLFDTALFDEKKKSVDVQKWLNIEKTTHAHKHEHEHDHHGHGHDHHHDHHHHHHHHDVNKHGDNIETFSLIIDKPLISHSFVLAMQLLISEHGKDLLRIKGIVNLKERAGQPYIIHGVQHIFHEPLELKKWPSDDHRTKIVFITRGIPRKTIEAYFEAWMKVDEHHHLVLS
ncbi:MAG: GTP-binding protein [Methylocystaceae bacterium]|nr:GTP-binding protein [Methylocystaceae bacterium]